MSVDVDLACWNCRGLKDSLPYLDSLIGRGIRIIAIAEHWLWPYELYTLSCIHPDYDATGVADGRLNEGTSGARDCGGIGMIWKKSFGGVPIGGITSDHLCGMRFSLGLTKVTMSVLGVYLPCLDQGMNVYLEHENWSAWLQSLDYLVLLL